MKNIFALLLFLNFGFAAFAQHEGHNMPVQQHKQATIYTCPIHPEVQSTKSGTCPKCGMALVRQKPKSSPKPVPKAVPKPPAKPATEPMVMPKEPARKTVGKEAKKPKPPVLNEDIKTEPIVKVGHKIESPALTYKPKKVRYDLYV